MNYKILNQEKTSKTETKRIKNNTISLLRNCQRKKNKYHASMTVEAAFILPFFLFAFLNLISIIEIYRLQSNISAAMHLTAKEMAVYGYEYRELAGSDTTKAASLGLTYLYAQNKVRNILGNGYLNNAPITGSMNWIRSKVMEHDDIVDLVAIYRVKPPVAAIGFGESPFYNRIRTRAWTGYDAASNAGSADGEEEIVYITPEGTVYHKSRSCTYLKLSISAVDIDFLEQQRNESGGIYYPCESCGGHCGNTVYITEYGTRYHATLQCSKLKRTILAIPISQAEGRGGCSKCAG